MASNVLVTADLRQDGEALRVTAQDVASLDQAAANAGAAMRIWLRETASVPHIRDLLGREGRGKGRVILVPRLGHHAERRDRAAGRLQRDAAAGAGSEGDPRRRAGRGALTPHSWMQCPAMMPIGTDSSNQAVARFSALITNPCGNSRRPQAPTTIEAAISTGTIRAARSSNTDTITHSPRAIPRSSVVTSVCAGIVPRPERAEKLTCYSLLIFIINRRVSNFPTIQPNCHRFAIDVSRDEDSRPELDSNRAGRGRDIGH